ncbi:hypothetical protein VTN49DRAFT_1607 [Thermomyces lanuginosus]|uniref:uncharacterized protein n=1 Tax=Thermomyces lanuginosus TaxID=5541 RepID=UPI003742623F
MSPFEAASQVRFTAMHYDIVGSLPLELLLYVMKHLDLEDIVQNQRVSKRWRTIFSCHAVIEPALRETLAFLDLDHEVDGANVTIADAMRYLRWRYGLQHVRPVQEDLPPLAKTMAQNIR